MPTIENGILHAEKVAAAALANIEVSAVLSAMVTRYPDAEFTGATGHVVNIRRPSMLNGFEEDIDAGTPAGSRQIQTEGLNEHSVPVVLDTHVYSAVALSDAEMSLSVTDFSGQVVLPQTDAMVNRLERKLAAAFETLPLAETITIETTDGAPTIGYTEAAQQIRFAIARLSAQLTRQNVPVAGRYLVLGAEIAGWLMNDPNLTRANEAGSGTALRESVIGRLHGFDLVQDHRVDSKTLYAFHPSVIQLVTRAPAVPQAGVAAGVSSADGGYAVRWVRDYDSNTASERSFLSAYVGVSVLQDATRKADGTVDVDVNGKPVLKVIRGLRAKLDVVPSP